MIVTKAFIQYLVHFHGDRDYFECHEILEDHWKQQDARNRDSIWIAFIQLAVSLYHYRRKNLIGGIRMMEKALQRFIHKKDQLLLLKIDVDDLISKINTVLDKMKTNQDYEPIQIKIDDQQLLDICKEECKKLGVTWGGKEDLSNDPIIHRHKLRDRSTVENERFLSSVIKKMERNEGKFINN
ncbi:DUF309 domain-containing protein [Heyndrickxia oleronia]|uniref:DUF309 domain-containing protein n=1 Tax=Heyndrickxia oleronia TaxID=38875 RepID=UPI00203CB949|nr:DUF309 domain-containing protein [Heyndrickxia oleronia]MCM3236873.1 DUF309 domain-containing protein [Heyndrickxia oleronia]